MKVALCFIISYEHIVNKEQIWIDWIESNKDIINVYFHYQDIKKIKSEWILKNIIPERNIVKTSYYHVVQAYMTLMNYAFFHDSENTWFCFLTDSCVPILSPSHFRKLFMEKYNKSILKWTYSWWNVLFHKRANLRFLPKEFRLAHDPWFVLTRQHVQICVDFSIRKRNMYKLICRGGLANESIFIIMLKCYLGENSLNIENIENQSTTMTDWSRMTSATSPYVFKSDNQYDKEWILKKKSENPEYIFLRKVDKNFPDFLLKEIINISSDCHNQYK